MDLEVAPGRKTSRNEIIMSKLNPITVVMLIVTTFGSIIPTIYLIFLTEDFLLYHKWPITLRGGPLIGICLLICIVSVIVMTPKIFARNVNI